MGYMGHWNLIADIDSVYSEYNRLKIELESIGKLLSSYGPAYVYGEEAKIYRFNDELYKIAWTMYGSRRIEKLQGAEYITLAGGQVLWAKEADSKIESDLEYLIRR